MDETPLLMDIKQLVEQYHGPVYGYAYRLTGSVADAEDLAQQVFLIAQQKIAQVRDDRCVQSWLFTVLRNCFLKERRRRQPVNEAALDVPLEDFSTTDWNDSPVDEERLQMAIEGLPSEYRVVLAMFYFEDLSYKEIAEELEIPLGTVMSRLCRGRRALRDNLIDIRPRSTRTKATHIKRVK